MSFCSLLFSFLAHKYSRWHLAEGWPQFDDCTEFQTQTNAKGISQYNKRGRICSRTWLSNTYKDIQNTFYMTIWIKRSTYKTSRFIVFFNASAASSFCFNFTLKFLHLLDTSR